MIIAVGADHAGYALKQQLAQALRQAGHEVIDDGTHSTESTDYPPYAAAVGRAVASGAADRGILVCATGVGMSIAANKIAGVRAALAVNPEEVQLTRRHNDANVLTLGARYTDAAAAAEYVKLFLENRSTAGATSGAWTKLRNWNGNNGKRNDRTRTHGTAAGRSGSRRFMTRSARKPSARIRAWN